MNRSLPAAVRGELVPGENVQEVRVKRCPFCNAATVCAVRGVLDDGTLSNFTIECTVCNAAGPPADNLEAAGARWNLRSR